MLVIRLSRVGKKNQAIFRIVVAEKEKSAKGKFIEELGTYNPRFENDNLKINQERIKYWLEHGAQPSLTMSGILKKEGILPEKIAKKYELEIEHMKKFKKSKKKESEGEEESGDKNNEEKPADEKKEEVKEDAKAKETEKKDKEAKVEEKK